MDRAHRSFKLKAGIAAFVTLAIGLSAAACIRAQESGVPDYDGEFFTDLTGKIPARQKVQISRTLRNGAQASRIHPMLVVMNKLADYPAMPQDLPHFIQNLASDWKIGDQQTKKGVLILFSIEDRKFGVEKTTNLDQSLTDKIKAAMGGRVTDALKEGDVTKAMLLAADNIVEALPDANLGQNNYSAPAQNAAPGPVKIVTRTVHEHRTLYHPFHADFQDGGFTGGNGFGFWWLIGAALLFFVFIGMLSSLFGGSRGYGPGVGGNYYGGGYGGGGGGGGFFSGMLTGGLFGYLLGDHNSYGGYNNSWQNTSSGNYTDTTTTETWTQPGSGGGGTDTSSSGGGSSDSGFDSFGGGSFDGGGSFGNW